MNIFEIRSETEIISLDVSTQEKIRLLYRLGFTRSEISKMLKVKYQVVFKGTNPKYSPKRWVKVLTLRNEEEKNKVSQDVEEVPLLKK